MELIVENKDYNGTFSIFREMVLQLGEKKREFAHYDNLINILNLKEGSKFISSVGDPGTPQPEFTNRIADGIINLVNDIVKKGFRITFNLGKTDFWTDYCLKILDQSIDDKLKVYIEKPAEINDINFDSCKDEQSAWLYLKKVQRFGLFWGSEDIYIASIRERNFNSLYFLYSAQVSMQKKDYLSAKQFLNKIIEQENTSHFILNAVLLLANIYIREQKYHNAKESIIYLQNLAYSQGQDRFYSWSYNLMAFNEIRNGDPIVALNFLKEGISLAEKYKLKKNLGLFYRNYGHLLFSLDKNNLNINLEYLNKSIELRPYDQDLYCEMGSKLLLTNKLNEAKEYYQYIAVPYLPHPDGYAGLGVIDRINGNFKRSTEYIKYAESIRPNNIQYKIDLAKTIQKSGGEGNVLKSIKYLCDVWIATDLNEVVGCSLFEEIFIHNLYSKEINGKLIKHLPSSKDCFKSSYLNILIASFMNSLNNSSVIKFAKAASKDEEYQIPAYELLANYYYKNNNYILALKYSDLFLEFDNSVEVMKIRNRAKKELKREKT